MRQDSLRGQQSRSWGCSAQDLSHQPLPHSSVTALLLIHAAERWRGGESSEAGGAAAGPRGVPSNPRERSAFKELLRSMQRTVHGMPAEAENIDEALKAAFQVWTPYVIRA